MGSRMAGKDLGVVEHHKLKLHQQRGGVTKRPGIGRGCWVQGRGADSPALPVQHQDPFRVKGPEVEKSRRNQYSGYIQRNLALKERSEEVVSI